MTLIPLAVVKKPCVGRSCARSILRHAEILGSQNSAIDVVRWRQLLRVTACDAWREDSLKDRDNLSCMCHAAGRSRNTSAWSESSKPWYTRLSRRSHSDPYPAGGNANVAANYPRWWFLLAGCVRSEVSIARAICQAWGIAASSKCHTLLLLEPKSVLAVSDFSSTGSLLPSLPGSRRSEQEV